MIERRERREALGRRVIRRRQTKEEECIRNDRHTEIKRIEGREGG